VAAIQTVRSEKEAGTALGTQPAAGTAAEPGTPVLLVTSGGPSGQAAD
jgi:beta-lactam-binding protein with PASTA domain